MNGNIGIYIHIPFCKTKCYYCDFNSFACRDEFVPAYFSALKKEIALYSEKLKGFNIKSVFIGGGTPSSVDAQYIYEVMHLIYKEFCIDKEAEISIEANPGTLTVEKLKTYKDIGINRISIGLQAWQDTILKRLGRIHTSEEFEQNFKAARKIGFDNINVDLIFGIPGQTVEDWRYTLEMVTALEPEHLSCYSLKIEEGTVFGNMLERGELVPLEDDIDREMYSFCKDYLLKKGYRHYEISNFAKPGFTCRHNLIYWQAEEYIGFGTGAHSFFESARFNNKYDLEGYINDIKEGKAVSENFEFINEKERMAEFMILGLRLIDGVRMEDFRRRFNEEIHKVYGHQIDRMVEKNLLTVKDGRIALSSLGLDFANQVFMEFI
ncbi:radical SAM family heme chaperone HemW [Acetivibrio clariflavus]|uniref:Heme chaperone HemW n=1 Tax=Acetivibrio clariflavus (strain DSM 19732 / NBRC 101661 / EBR45) TaxID=720554 RepID=G8M315_ACECE|nr:radical SAM family heme chaperone HemW [Acetivibrio clariflavus]AEV69324.1 putative oxygen-independent coproporphyrinogen III oxidase [Acetivibrio clariflavus DSM 19732]